MNCVDLQNQISAKTLECSQIQSDLTACQTQLTSMWMMYYMYCGGA